MRPRFERVRYRLTAQSRTSIGQRLWDDFKALGMLLLIWQQRARQRHHLAEMSDHLRRDLGLTEAEKPFWRR